jgi:hypothetical protein
VGTQDFRDYTPREMEKGCHRGVGGRGKLEASAIVSEAPLHINPFFFFLHAVEFKCKQICSRALTRYGSLP